MATQNPVEDEFVQISEEITEPETKIVFDTIGDQFTGIYLGMRQQENYQQARFQSVDNDEVFFVNANYSLRNGLKNARPGQKVRITFTSETDTGQPNPMRNFTVEVARPKTGVTNVRRAGQVSKPSS